VKNDDESNLRNALRTIREAVPQAARAQFQTSDQDYYGFNLTDILLADGTSAMDPQDTTEFDRLSNDLFDYLCNLSWNGVMGEDRGGAADLEIPTAEQLAAQDAARYARLARVPSLPQALPQWPDADNIADSPDETWGGLSLAELRTQDWDGDGSFRDFADAEADTQHDNTRRAGFALLALGAYADRVGTDEESVISDLIGDLRHLCDALGEDFDTQAERSLLHYNAEILGEH
jgi:hypothetical protein